MLEERSCPQCGYSRMVRDILNARPYCLHCGFIYHRYP
jgi:uncharacterized protein (DUF983 family)